MLETGKLVDTVEHLIDKYPNILLVETKTELKESKYSAGWVNINNCQHFHPINIKRWQYQ